MLFFKREDNTLIWLEILVILSPTSFLFVKLGELYCKKVTNSLDKSRVRSDSCQGGRSLTALLAGALSNNWHDDQLPSSFLAANHPDSLVKDLASTALTGRLWTTVQTNLRCLSCHGSRTRLW